MQIKKMNSIDRIVQIDSLAHILRKVEYKEKIVKLKDLLDYLNDGGKIRCES